MTQLQPIISPIVEGQIKTFIAAHPAIAEAVDWRYSHASKSDALVSSLAKRITRALTCPETEARLRSALSGQTPSGERIHRQAQPASAAGTAGGEPTTPPAGSRP